jgi:hypothetical protein
MIDRSNLHHARFLPLGGSENRSEIEVIGHDNTVVDQ